MLSRIEILSQSLPNPLQNDKLWRHEQQKPSLSNTRGFSFLEAALCKHFFEESSRNLCFSNFIHSCSASWAFSLHCWFTIFHGHRLCFWIIALCTTFYAVHGCHSSFTPFQRLLKNDSVRNTRNTN